MENCSGFISMNGGGGGGVEGTSWWLDTPPVKKIHPRTGLLAPSSLELHFSDSICQGLSSEGHDCNKRLSYKCLNAFFH